VISKLSANYIAHSPSSGVRIASRPESAEGEQRALVLEQEALQVQPAAEPG
jgi:hypothetical protein